MGILGGIADFVGDLFGGAGSSDVTDLIGSSPDLFGSGLSAATAEASDSFLGGFFDGVSTGDFLRPTLGAIATLGTDAMRREDPRLTEARINQIEQTLEIERQRLALAQQKQGFDAELQKKQIEIQLAMAALDAARQSVPDRTQEIQTIQQGAGQRTQDTNTVLRALESVTAGAQRGVK